jgi:hypothetical protein
MIYNMRKNERQLICAYYWLIFFCATFSLLSFGRADTTSPEEARARFIYQQLTARRLLPNTPAFTQMVSLIKQRKLFEAGALAAQEPSFIGSTVRLWSTSILSADGDPNMPLNDSLAFLMGSVRDNLDGRLILTGNFIYGRDPRSGPGRPAVNSDTLFDEMENQSRDLAKTLYSYSPQWNLAEAKEAAGLLTTRWWASRNYSAGTNRRTIPATFDAFLCLKIDRWKKPGLPTFRIRQDIDRFPQDNGRVFQTECRTCHGAMDGLAGAFSKIDFANGRITWLPMVTSKYLQHSEIYPDGFVTTDNSWINFLADDPSEVFGWKTSGQGVGIGELGQMFAQSDQFARCLVQRAVQVVCRKDLDFRDPWILNLASEFRQSGYQLKKMFISVATHEECDSIGGPNEKESSSRFSPRFNDGVFRVGGSGLHTKRASDSVCTRVRDGSVEP